MLLRLEIRRLLIRRIQDRTLFTGTISTPLGRAPRCARLLLWSLAMASRAVPMTAHP
jgi:hypothetical protein